MNYSRIIRSLALITTFALMTVTLVVSPALAQMAALTVSNGQTSIAFASTNVTGTTNITLSVSSARIGQPVTVTGTGFTASKSVTLLFDNKPVATASSDASGTFSATFAIPTTTAGSHTITAHDGTNGAAAQFTVTVGAELNQTSGYIGMPLTLSGSGFNGMVVVKYDSVEVGRVMADTNAAFITTFVTPPSVAGVRNITASDGINTAQATFTVESDAPPVPALILPAAGSKAEATAVFDWTDVSDPSGVSYTLQIATKPSFTEGSILLQKTKLTDSTYTITELERLESTKKAAPYYWRLKAIDGASNESKWSTPASFYVGSFFELPDSARYALIGAGILVLLILSFWLGRRTAYY